MRVWCVCSLGHVVIVMTDLIVIMSCFRIGFGGLPNVTIQAVLATAHMFLIYFDIN